MIMENKTIRKNNWINQENVGPLAARHQDSWEHAFKPSGFKPWEHAFKPTELGNFLSRSGGLIFRHRGFTAKDVDQTELRSTKCGFPAILTIKHPDLWMDFQEDWVCSHTHIF